MHLHKEANRPGHQTRRPRVLVIGPIGGAAGGVAMFTDILLASPLTERFELIHLDTTRGRAGEGKASSLAPINLVYFIRQLLRLLGILIVRRPAILHQPITSRISLWKEASFMLLGRLFGVRVIGHLHGGHIRTHIETSRGPGGAILRAILRLPHRTITLSDGWRDFLLETISRKLRIEVIPNTVEPRIAAMADAPSAGYRSHGCTILTLGRLEMRKGILDAIAAVRHARELIPELRLVCGGGLGPQKEWATVREACRDASSEGFGTFPGTVEGAQKVRLLGEADLFLLASLYENLPTVVLEAMAAGLPLILTRVGALPEILEERRHCLFVDPGDQGGLKEAIVVLMSNSDLRRRMGEANRALFRERFHPDAVLDHIGRLYEEILGTR